MQGHEVLWGSQTGEGSRLSSGKEGGSIRRTRGCWGNTWDPHASSPQGLGFCRTSIKVVMGGSGHKVWRVKCGGQPPRSEGPCSGPPWREGQPHLREDGPRRGGQAAGQSVVEPGEGGLQAETRPPHAALRSLSNRLACSSSPPRPPALLIICLCSVTGTSPGLGAPWGGGAWWPWYTYVCSQYVLSKFKWGR